MNRFAHAVAAPLVVFHALASFSFITVGAPFGHPLHLGYLAYVALLVFYARLDFALVCLMAPLLALVFPFAAICPRGLVLAMGVLGWMLQLGVPRLGGAGQLPSLRTLLFQALIGPLYLVATLIGLWPMRTTAMAL